MSGAADDRRRVERVREALPAGGLFHEKTWRVSPQAFRISADFADELDKLGYRLSKFVRACNDLYRLSSDGREPGWVAELLDRGKPRELIELGRERAFLQDIPRVIRPDVILTEDGYTIAELDSVPGGIGLTAWLGNVYSELGEDVLGGPDGMLEGLASILPGGGDIVVSEEAATYRPEMVYAAERMNAGKGAGEMSGRGIGWRVVDDSKRSDWQERVYRFFELFDWANVACADDLAERARSGDVAVTPPFKPWLEEKIWFALFWMKPLEDYWRRAVGDRTVTELRKVIPYSWVVDPAPLPVHAVLPRLEVNSWGEVGQLSQKDRELILKVSGFSETAWGSRGVVMAQDVPQNEWREALSDALEHWSDQPHLLQEFHKGRLVEQPWWDDASDEMSVIKGRVRLCPYFFLGDERDRVRCAGALATICPADKKLLHGMSDAILVPTSVG
ncbi:MAG: hypothetical protein WA771_12065 [Chthoniobacterales bacterium]